MQLRRALAVLTVVFSGFGLASAQVISMRKVGDKTVMCMRSGLSSDLKDCGVRSDWYTYVFLGSISAVTPIENGENEVQIIPEEVFHGRPATPFTVQTSQALCLPKLAVGDRWLFFLRAEKSKPIVLDYYGNDSSPVDDAQEQIETLRLMKTLGPFALVRGHVVRGRFGQREVVPAARVVAHRAVGNVEFVATTDTEGRYEFKPLPPGRYKFTVDPIGSFQPDAAALDVSPGACLDLTLSKRPHAQLGGHVLRSNGSPVPQLAVVMIGADDSWWTTSRADARGYFHFDSLSPGNYVIGINLPGAPAWKSGADGIGVAPPTASLYYSGALNRSAALVIKLADDEKRDDIDFIVPQ